jgi:hypothetical protein
MVFDLKKADCMKKMGLFLVALAVVVLAGCAAPVAPRPFVNTQSVVASYDQVWDGVMEVLAQNNVQIKTLAKDSGFVAAESQRFNDAFAVCDERMVHNVRKAASFNIRLQRGEQAQKMTVNAEWRMVGRNTITGYPEERECASTGVLEGYLMKRAAAGLPVAPGAAGAPQARAEVGASTGIYQPAQLLDRNGFKSSGFAKLEDAQSVPASANCKFIYETKFLPAPYPRAFALGGKQANGARTCVVKMGRNAAVYAIEECTQFADTMKVAPCVMYAVDDRVVWQPID